MFKFVFEDANSTAGLSLCHNVMQLPALHRHVISAMLFLVTLNTSLPYSSRSAYCNHSYFLLPNRQPG